MGGISCFVRRVLFPTLGFSLTLEAQVIIRDTLAINPSAPRVKPTSTTGGPLLRLINTGFTTVAETTVPGVSISASVNAEPPDLPFGTGYEIFLSAGGSSYLIQQKTNGCPGGGGQPTNPFPLTILRCGWISVTARTYVPAPYVWSCGVRSAGVEVTVDGNRAVYRIFGTLWYVPFAATVTVTATLDPDRQLSSATVLPQPDRLDCGGVAAVDVRVLDALGNPYVPCHGILTGVAEISAFGPYAFLSNGVQSGTSVTFPIQNGSGSFLAILDTSKGIIPSGHDAALLKVQVEGVRQTASLLLACSYPPPSVAIVFPSSDTTLFLSADHQPSLVLREIHTPQKGPFEPSITWSPGPVFNTAGYFPQFEDSLVVDVKAVATNAGGQASAIRKITLKKDPDPLDHFDIAFGRDVISCDDAVPVTVAAKDKQGNTIKIDGSTLVNIVLKSDEQYGSLLGLDGTPTKHVQVLYADAAAGLIAFRAECPGPVPPSGLQVQVGVTKAGQESKQGIATITVMGNPELVIVDPSSGTRELKISPAPSMPALTAVAALRNYRGGRVTFRWTLTVRWKTPEPRVVEEIFRGETAAENSEPSTWVVDWAGRIRGGDDVLLRVTAQTGQGSYDAEIKNPYRIVGENPDSRVVKEGLTLEEQVLVYKESLPKWSQFRNGFPIFGRPRGYGLMQIDNPRATDDQVWDWRANREAGKNLFSQKKNWAATYGRDIRRGKTWFKRSDGTIGYNQPIKPNREWYPHKYVNASDLSTNDELLIESFQRYNGGVWWRWRPNDIDKSETHGKWERAFSSERYGDDAWSIYTNIVQHNKYPAGWNK